MIQPVTLPDGEWYVRISGDYLGSVTGSVLLQNADGSTSKMSTTPPWDGCTAPPVPLAPAAVSRRRRQLLLEEALEDAAAAEVSGDEAAALWRALVDAAGGPEAVRRRGRELLELAEDGE